MTESLKFKIETREILFYNKYIYCVSGDFYAADRVNRYYNTADIKTKLIQTQRRWNNYLLPYNFGEDDNVTRKVVTQATRLQKFIAKVKKDDTGLIRAEGNRLSFFTNDETMLKKFPKGNNKPVYRKIKQCELGIKTFKRTPPAAFRSYMKASNISNEALDELIEFINKNADINPSDSFKKWLFRRKQYNWRHNYMYSTFYIDYDNESLRTFMYLKFSDILGKPYKLIKEDELS